MTDCDFDLSCLIVSSDGTTTLVDLHDHAAGIDLMRPLVWPDETIREGRVSSSRVPGSFRVWSTADDGFIPLRVLLRGTDWPTVEATFETVRAALKTEPRFLLKITVEGVTRTWRAELSAIQFDEIEVDLPFNKQMSYAVVLRVQPNPVVTYA